MVWEGNVADAEQVTFAMSSAEPAAAYTITFPDETGTVCTDGSICTGYAALAGPAFTGDPTAPTAAADDSDTSIATTAFVQQEHDDSAGSCTNQVVTAVNASAAPTCADVVSAMVTDDTLTTADLNDSTDTPLEGQLLAVGQTTTEMRYVKPPPVTKTLFDSGGLAATDDVPDIHIWAEAVEVTDVRCISTGGTSITITLEDDTGNDLVTSCVCTTSLVDCTLAAGVTFTALERLDWVTESISATPTSATVFIEYKYDL
jgi:hypothetical protein